MSPTSMHSGGSGQDAALLQRLIAGIAVVVVGILLGKMIPSNALLPVAIVAAFGLVFMLLTRPVLFVLLGIFFYYGTMRIVDTEVFGRVAGLFRLKDVFLAMMVLHIIATEIANPSERFVPRSATSFRFFLVFMLWIAFQMARTAVLLGEDPVLMLRVCRHFLTYGFFLFLLYYLRNEKDWQTLRRYMHGLAFLAMFLALLNVFGVNVTLYPRGAAAHGGFFHGVWKLASPGESLVFALFMYNVWRYCFRPTLRNALMAILMAAGCTFFIFRARLAGVALGMFVAMFLAPARVRWRAIVLGVVLAFSLLLALLAFGVIAARVGDMERQSYLGNLADYFDEARRGVTQGNTKDVLLREYFVETRWPLVKENPWLGIGFVSPFGEIAWQMYRLGDMPIGHVDVGWLDAMMRLGGVGTAILSVFLVSVALEGRKILRIKGLTETEYAFALTAVGFVVLMFVSTYSFAYPTREEPILTFSLLFAWLMYVRRKSPAPAVKAADGREAPRDGQRVAPVRSPVIRPNQQRM